MNCKTCPLKNIRTDLTGKEVCRKKLMRPKTYQAFLNVVKNSGFASVCPASPFLKQPYGEKNHGNQN